MLVHLSHLPMNDDSLPASSSAHCSSRQLKAAVVRALSFAHRQAISVAAQVVDEIAAVIQGVAHAGNPATCAVATPARAMTAKVEDENCMLDEDGKIKIKYP
jgi:hypothetical protein